MRIAVALPPLRDFYLSPRRMSALGCRTVVRLLEEAGGHTVVSPARRAEASAQENAEASEHGEPFLFPLMGKPHSLPLPREAAYLNEWLLPGESGPLSFFTAFQRFGPDPAEAAGMIAREQPQAVFVSSFAYAYAEDAVLFAAALRKLMPETLIVAGGAGPSSWPDYYLHPPAELYNQADRGRPVFDAVFTGEAETGLPLLLAFLTDRLSANNSGTNRRTSVLIQAPASSSAESLSCVFAIQRQTKKEAWISTSLSRGCPQGCRFCSAHLCHGRQFRAVAHKEIAAAADKLPRELTEKHIHLTFEDDNMLQDEAWFSGVLRIFRERFPRVSFSAENGLDYRLLGPAALRQLIAAGFESFNLSLADIDEEKAAPSRQTDVKKFLAAARGIAEKGLPLVSYFIAGLEDSTPEKIVRNLAFLAQTPGLAGISLFYPVPGIPGFDPPPETLRRYPGLARGSFAWPWTGSLSTGELVTAFRLARLVNLAKKSSRSADEEELLARCFAEKRLFTLQREKEKTRAGRKGSPRLTPAPTDREMEKLFFRKISRSRTLHSE